ncbi:MAG: 3-5 exonuclease [Gemmatimonadetes bacterium]|nr:3-5 exonuclease [Gemmatimonadota bacterium]
MSPHQRTVHEPHYLDQPAATSAFLAGISATPIIALDTEGASFHRFIDRIYLLQLSTREQSAIIDPLAVSAGDLSGLGALLENPAVEIVFHDADYDLRLLVQDYKWRVKNIFDTRVAAQLLGIKAFGLGALLEKYQGLKLEKKHQRADWSMRPLTHDMLEYAAQDTMYLLQLRDQLKDELEHKGRWSWAREEFGLLEGTQWEPDETGMGFLKMKGARDLNRRELAVLKEVAQWRDMVAGKMDKATFRVLGNEQLFAIAQGQPATTDALGKIKGMPRGILENRGHELLDAVKRGLAVPEEQLPKFPRGLRWDRDPDFDARSNALKTVRDEFAAKLDLDPGVLSSRDRMEAVARRNPSSVAELEEVKELRGWQREVLGAGFIKALAPHRKKEPSPYKDASS